MTHTTFPRTTACWTIRNDCMSIGIIRTRFLLAHSTTSSTSSRSTTTRAIISRRATTSYIATIIKAIQRTAIATTYIFRDLNFSSTFTSYTSNLAISTAIATLNLSRPKIAIIIHHIGCCHPLSHTSITSSLTTSLTSTTRNDIIRLTKRWQAQKNKNKATRCFILLSLYAHSPLLGD